MPRSNDMGRAFEFALCDQIINIFKNVTLTERAMYEQQRDIQHFEYLNFKTQNSYVESSTLICYNWLSNKINPRESYRLDRLPDSAGVYGDVTDIRIISERECLNISLKHNHDALKHPRLTRLPNWIGLNYDDEYTRIHNEIWDNFFELVEVVAPNATLFRDLTIIDRDFVNDNLYDPFCAFVADYLSENTSSPHAVRQMFNFLVGTYDFYKIIDRNDFIAIQEFINIPIPTRVKIKQTDRSHISMIFDNGIELNLRLHTASSRLIRSVKFDVRGIFDSIPTLIIEKSDKNYEASYY